MVDQGYGLGQRNNETVWWGLAVYLKMKSEDDMFSLASW
jgi:hypothetical protein